MSSAKKLSAVDADAAPTCWWLACDVPGFWVRIYYAIIIWCSCSVSAGPAGAAVGFEAAATT